MTVNKRFRKIIAAAGIFALMLSLTACSGCGGNPVSENPSSEIITSEVTSQTENTSEKSEKDSEKKSEQNSEGKEVADGRTPFEIHGALSVDGNHIVDEHGEPFRICGVSTHGLSWFPQYVNKQAVKSLRDDIGANTLRLAMYTAEGQGYCTGGDQSKLKNLVSSGVDFATNEGMYVIIDWHILHDLDPNVYKDEAKAFFDEMSKKYADHGNVLYEICNEPNGGTSWEQVKTYADEVIPVIRANDPDAIIIVGTPNWSQDVDVAIKNPITGQKNIVYAVHFYADTHKDDIRNKVKTAEDAGYPVLISEFSICDASGNGNNNIGEANTWIQLLDQYGIGFVAWNLSNKAESSSILSEHCKKTSGWEYDDLSDSGKWLVGVFNSHSDQGSRLARGEGSASGVQPEVIVIDNPDREDDGQQGGEEVASGGSDNLSVTVSKSNSWTEGSDTCTQYSLALKNSGSANSSSWTVTIDFGTAVTISQIWGGKASVSGNTVTITPESYNGSIAAGSTLSDVGLIVKSASAPSGVKANVK